MKICHFSNRFWPCEGGIETIIMDYCLELKKKGHKSRVVCLNKCANSNKVLPVTDSVNGISIKRLPFLDLGFYRISPSVIFSLKDCDVLHVHGIGFFADALILLKLFHGKPVVLSTHGGIFHTSKGLLKRIYFYAWNRFLLRFADKVIAVSENDARLFSRIVPKEKISIVENGLRLKNFSKLGGKKEKSTFLFVGRLSKNKRIDLLLEAFAIVFKKNKKARLFIVGGDFEGLLSGLKKKAQKLGISKQVKFAGAVSSTKLLEYYSKAEFFVSSSEYEGFGVSALEAMASGCIPVLNRIPTFEKIVFDSRAGFVVDFFQPKKAAEKILQILSLSEKQKQLFSIRAKNAVKKFSWNERIRDLIKVYSSVMGSRK